MRPGINGPPLGGGASSSSSSNSNSGGRRSPLSMLRLLDVALEIGRGLGFVRSTSFLEEVEAFVYRYASMGLAGLLKVMIGDDWVVLWRVGVIVCVCVYTSVFGEDWVCACGHTVSVRSSSPLLNQSIDTSIGPPAWTGPFDPNQLFQPTNKPSLNPSHHTTPTLMLSPTQNQNQPNTAPAVPIRGLGAADVGHRRLRRRLPAHHAHQAPREGAWFCLLFLFISPFFDA
jgi:hypothetical protein